jgi:autotransporter-associated beta strand protein
MLLALVLACVWSPFLHATSADDFRAADFDFSSGLELFHSGPNWFADALPGAKRGQSRHVFDRAGDAAESTGRSAGYVGTLSDAFEISEFGSGANFGRTGRASASLPAGPSAPNAIITWVGAGSAWLNGTNWDSNTVPASADTATFSTNAGDMAITINFGGSTNNGAANQIVGAIALTGGEPKSISSSTATGGTLTLNGVGGNLLSNSSAFSLTLQNGGASAMNVALANSGAINVTSTGAITISSSISGAGTGFTKTGSGALNLSGANFYSGGTTLSSGTINLSGSGTLGSTTNALTVNGGTLNLGGTNQTVGALNGTGGAINTSTGSSTLTVGNGGGSGSFAGSITNTGTVALTKTGSGTQTLTNNNSYTGPTIIEGGTLELKNTGGVPALTGTSSVAVNNGGTLLFSANNQLNQALPPDISLGSGSGTAKIDAGGFSQGGSGTAGNAGLGALTLNSNATIDLTSTSVLHFADSTGENWTGTLSILNWSGAPTTGGGLEQLLFGTGGILPGVDPAQLSQIQFIDPVGFAAGTYSAIYATTNLNEIVPGVPIPEPGTWFGGALALAAVAFTQRRRLRGFFARNPIQLEGRALSRPT